MNIIIREATTEDAALIADLSRETFYDTFAAGNAKEDMDKFLNEQFTREALMQEVGAEGNIFLIALINNEVAGYARLREKDADSIEIARIYAATIMIGKGVGKTLMEESVRIARNKKKDFIWLGVWEKNERAIKFYERFGFEKFGEHPFLLGNDLQTDWLMKKMLNT
jgi:ribosomal protein S18 acetylase RimI-like enzyme